MFVYESYRTQGRTGGRSLRNVPDKRSEERALVAAFSGIIQVMSRGWSQTSFVARPCDRGQSLGVSLSVSNKDLRNQEHC